MSGVTQQVAVSLDPSTLTAPLRVFEVELPITRRNQTKTNKANDAHKPNKANSTQLARREWKGLLIYLAALSTLGSRRLLHLSTAR